jgi:hypothetical protein
MLQSRPMSNQSTSWKYVNELDSKTNQFHDTLQNGLRTVELSFFTMEQSTNVATISYCYTWMGAGQMIAWIKLFIDLVQKGKVKTTNQEKRI